MFTTTRLRKLRLRYGITLVELAARSGVSNQHISRLELGLASASKNQADALARALEETIAHRQSEVILLERDLLLYRNTLLEPMEAESDE